MIAQLPRQDDATRFDSVAAVFAVDLNQHIVSTTPAADAILARQPDEAAPCYEVMRALDRRNFRKKMLASGLLSASPETRRGAHRPARLFEFAERRLVAVDVL